MTRCTIIGAGLSGLALARTLDSAKYEVQVFERDAGPHERPQGSFIGLSISTGRAAFEMLGLASALESRGERVLSFTFMAAEGRELFTLRLPPAYALLGVPRAAMYELLLQGLSARVHWGKCFQRYEERGDEVIVHFEDGTEVSSDLVIACDGVGSRVRNQRVGDTAKDLGLASVAALLPLENAQKSALTTEGNSFITLLLAGSVFIQRCAPIGKLLWSFTESTDSGLDQMGPAQALAHVKQRARGSYDSLQALLNVTHEQHMLPAYRLRDRGLDFEHRPGRVMLMGDAAHAMSPFQGQGGNMALFNAVTVGRALSDIGASGLPSRVAALEAEAIERTRTSWLSSRRAARDFLAPDAAERVLEWRHGPLT